MNEIEDPNDVISDWLREESEKHGIREPGSLYVTDLVRCSLKLAFEIKYPEIFKSQIFSQPLVHGTLMHIGIEKILKEKYESLGYNVSEEYEVEKAFNGRLVKGRIDLLLLKGDSKFVLEVKTSKGRGSWPQEHHLEQLSIYMNMVEASGGILFYISPDARATYYNDKVMSDDEIQTRIKEVISGSVAPRYDWECKYCLYSHLCSKFIKM